MEHYKSRNNDFFHFTNPHDDRSQLDDDDYDELQYDDVDDDRSCDFNFHTFRSLEITHSTPPNFQIDALTSSNEELGAFDNGDLVIEIEHTMKNLSDKLQNTIEGIGDRISRLDNETCKLDKCVEDVKNSAEWYHRTTHGKLRQMQSRLQEVQDGVLFLRDKHEIAEAQLQVAKLQDSKRDQINAAQKNPQQQIPSTASQSSYDISSKSLFYVAPDSQAPVYSAQQYPVSPNQQSQTPHQNKAEPQFPHFTQSYPPISSQTRHFLSHNSLETPNGSSYSYSSNIQHYPSQPANWGSTQEHEVGSTHLTHVRPSRNYKSEFHAKYMPESASFSDIHPYGEPPFLYSHVPVAKELPHALPTASDVEDRSSTEQNGDTIPADDIVEKVTAMGFRRDLVKGSVKKLTENGSSLDLNLVLDRMMKNT